LGINFRPIPKRYFSDWEDGGDREEKTSNTNLKNADRDCQSKIDNGITFDQSRRSSGSALNLFTNVAVQHLSK
jgi:hypothetical protein